MPRPYWRMHDSGHGNSPAGIAAGGAVVVSTVGMDDVATRCLLEQDNEQDDDEKKCQ